MMHSPTPKESPGPLERMGLKSPGSVLRSPFQRSPFVHLEDGGSTFSFSLRKANGVSLGLEMVWGSPDDEEMTVTKIKPGGAIATWNNQCIGGPGAGKSVAVGDKITSVNGETNVEKMLQECREQTLLRLTITRKPSSEESSPNLSHHRSPLESPPQIERDYLPRVEPREMLPPFQQQLSLSEQLNMGAMDMPMLPPPMPSADAYGALFECWNQETALPLAPPPGL